ncbi:oligosaccharide flippase family protein [Hydrogenophaga sp.]|jgi:O-antigen/teichoic acid export membrane protein|uniref:oligosaccharide flippase family protein n=1 Tax=Hydrogenophaga sp. TaxID=1904254 RepID=UPI003F700E30
MWTMVMFGLGQILRLGSNIILAAILFEEVFALMAIVTAVMMGLGMFTNIGLNTNVIQNARGDDPEFLNTAWTLQVIRGFFLFLVSVLMAWPLSRIYGANDPQAYELLYLIPIVAFGTLIQGFQSSKHFTTVRHLRMKDIAKLELIHGPVNTALTLLLAWYLKSAYALAISAILSSALYAALGYWMLKGQKSRFCWNREAVKTIISFGKWITVGTLFTFLALQSDRLVLAGMYALGEFGVYSIAASLAVIVPTLVAQIQWSVLFPWYSRMLEQGMSLPMAFARTRTAMMVISSFLCALLIAGAGTFFELAYDQRYAMGGVLLPILAVGAWFNCLENMYGAAFVASGRPMWTAITSGSKVASFALLLIPISVFKLDLVYAAAFLSVSEVVRWFVGQWLGRSLGLRNARVEMGMCAFFLSISLAGYWLVTHAPYVSELKPFWRLAVLGCVTTALFAPLFLRYVLPLVRQR